MAKATKKKNLRLRKRIRKTIGTMLLISSLIVAAIPVDSFEGGTAQAEPLGSSTLFPGNFANADANYISEAESLVPKIDTNETVYTTGDGLFQYAYVYKKGQNSGTKVAVIIGYNSSMLEGNTLTIPDTVDVYKKMSHSYGSSKGYVAVGKGGNELWYKVDEHKKYIVGSSEPDTSKHEVVKDGYIYTAVPRVDASGNPVMDPNDTTQQIVDYTPVLWPRVYPCYYDDRAKWENIDPNELYTPKGGNYDAMGGDINNPVYYDKTTTEENRRVQGITVAYIGNQPLVSTVEADGSTAWSIGPWLTPDMVEAGTHTGVFASKGNIVNLVIGSQLEGIGDFAFYNCSGLNSIELGNGINTVGNYAFANCVNLRNVAIPKNCNITAFGSHAFYNCQSITEFNVPVNVLELGDYCFSKCRDLVNLTMYYEDGTKVLLNDIGAHCFTECPNLEKLIFPASVDEAEHGTKINLSMFRGSTALKHITFMSNAMSITIPSGDTYGFTEFRNEMIPEFYFEGLDRLTLHQQCNDNEIAYKYLDKDLYEIVIKDESGNKTTYRVNSENQLKEVVIDPAVKEVEMPNTVGPYQILNIDSTSFRNKCNIEKIVIPASILTISEYAFQGCHNLKHVIFENADNIQSIGTDAFQTQKVDSGVCSHTISSSKPTLTFTGTISNSSVPFNYAMNPNSRINQGAQPISYITYYSGWPSNLTVEYMQTTDDSGNVVGMSTLVDYPIFSDLELKFDDANTYPYLTADMIAAANSAPGKMHATETMTQDELAIVDACKNLVIPEGVKSIKKDLFKDKEAADLANPTYKNEKKTVTTNSIATVTDGMFTNWDNLKAAYILGDATSIGDYAFDDCDILDTVQISPNVSSLGLRPFRGCPALNDVDFMGSSYFTSEKGIIFGLNGGAKSALVECLESRGVSNQTSYIQAAELAGVTSIQKEAFMDCLGVAEIDLRQSKVAKIPSGSIALSDPALKASSKLSRVLLPATCGNIEENAFKNSTVSYVEIPGSVAVIHPDAFDTNINESKDGRTGCVDPLTFYCEPESVAAIYAGGYTNIQVVDREPDAESVIVILQYLDPVTQQYHTIDTQMVMTGSAAIKPALEDLPKIEGYSFLKWLPSDDFSNITTGTTFTAIYSNTQYAVNFYECDEHGNELIGTITVPEGSNVTELDYPQYTPKEGYNIIGWTGLVNPVSENLNVYAKCALDEFVVRFWDADGTTLLFSQTGKSGDTLYEPKSPTQSGKTFAGWIPAVTATITGNADFYATYKDGNGNISGGGADSNGGVISDGKYYTLTVKNGSGSGSYVAGSEVIITANAPASGQEFKNWTADTTDAKIVGDKNTAAVIVMPAKSVTVTANYKSASGTNAGVGGGSSNSAGSGNSGSGNVVGNVSSGGTTVVIDKNGFSNQGVVSVKVNGASDNFVIKISESATATEAVVKALMDKYGTLDNIVYFPMDISLYDSTGTKKITDTTGLSISITLPIPDSLIKYAGNNKVAAVTNGKLESLTPKFTTIDKVSCVTFTAEHFSPYVIYVDKENLTAGTVTDNSPQTGDGIHPKWLLSMGLLCIAMVLFMKKDRVTTNTKVLV